MKRVLRFVCMALVAVAAVPAALGIALIWVVYRLADRVISLNNSKEDNR